MTQHGWNTCYPRPQLRRDSFFCLNEGWTLDGKPINVPWPPQAPLAEFEGAVRDELLYECAFTMPEGFLPERHRLMLHFGAVDQVAEAEVNGRQVVRHEGGYLPFSADITDAVRRSGENRLVVRAVDTLCLDYPYGKQHKRPHGMWYTPVSGIWQTVWLEAVPEHGAVKALRLTPDLAGVTAEADTGGAAFTVRVALEDGGTLEASGTGRVRIEVPRPQLWTPEEPYLYAMTITTETDRVESYFALRTVETKRVAGHDRLCLNGEPVFLHGVLDQGYFEDGLFLPREPEEYERDVLRMKELGYNTLRKHIKIEPEAFYYACDRLGMLVMQDMVNAGRYRYVSDTVIPTFVSKKRKDKGRGRGKARKTFFERHCMDTLAHLHNHPCIIGWTIFNEGWGQYDSDRIYRDCKRADPSRFFVSASGWFAQKESDVESEHVYFKSKVLTAHRPGQFLLISECGGFSRRVEGHVAPRRKNYGYGEVAGTEQDLTRRIQEMYRDMVLPSIPNGLCGCIYTQLSDVEGETNGLYTYDRAVRKADGAALAEISVKLREALWAAVRA